MAIAFVANYCNASAVTAVGAITIPLTTPNLITAGNTLFLMVNATNSTPTVPSINGGAAVTDPRGNVWVPEVVNNYSDGVAAGGTIQVYRCLVVTPYIGGDNLTIQGSVASLNVGFQVFEFSGVSQGTHGLYSAANRGVSTTTSTGLPVSVSATGQLVLVLGGVDSTNVVVTDTDTLDGTWTAAFRKNIGTNFQMWESHKILTGFTSATQTYNATWTSSGGDNLWGQIAVVYQPLSPSGSAIAQQFPPQDNPNYGCPDSGFEPMPVGSAVVPVDTGTAYQIEHTLPAYSFGTAYYSAVAQYDDTQSITQQHHIAYDLYQKGAEAPQDTVTQLIFPCSSAALGADATVLLNGTVVSNAFALQALQASGGYYLRLDGTPVTQASYGPYVTCRFDLYNTTGLGQYNILDYANSRIVRIGLRYTAWKDDSSTTAVPVGEGLQVTYGLAVGNPVQIYQTELGAWLVPDYQRSATEQIRWLGETNPLPKIPNSTSFYGGSSNVWFRTPPDAGTSWSYTDVLNLAQDPTSVNPNGTDSFTFWGLAGADFSQTSVYLDKVELIVEVAPERRLGNAIHNVATTPQYSFSPLGAAQYSPGRASIVTLRAVNNQANILVVSGSPNDYVLSAREALPASSSDYYPALATAPAAPAVGGILLSTLSPNIPYNLPQANGIQLFTPSEAVGPSLEFLGYTQPRNMSPNQRPLVQRTVVDGVFADSGTLMTQYELSFGALDQGNFLSAGSFFPVFRSMAPLNALKVYTGHLQTQRIYTNLGSAYTRVRIVCKPDPLTTLPLVFKVNGGATTNINVSDFAAGENIGNGWRAVSVPIGTGSTAGTGAPTILEFSSSTPSTAPWQVAAVISVGPSITTSFEPFAQNSAQGVYAYAAILECALPVPTATLTSSTLSITPPVHSNCVINSMNVPVINLTNGASFNRMVVERSLGNTGPWEVAYRLTGTTDSSHVLDYEVPWDAPQLDGTLLVYYRVTGYRDSDRTSTSAIFGPWGGTSVAPGAAFGLASNELGAIIMYVPEDSGNLQLTWTALNPVQVIPLHMQDYQYSLRIPENRGLSVSTNVLVNQFQACLLPTSSGYAAYVAEMLSYYQEKIGSGAYSMTPRPYEVSLLPVFNSTFGWTLKLPGGHTRRVTVTDVGSMTITTANGLYMSSITLTDVTPLSADPYSEL